MRAGDVWVGVSAQTIGVEGGPVAREGVGRRGRRGPGQGPQEDRSGARTARSSTRATASRSTSSRRSHAALRTGAGLEWIAAAAADRGGRVAVGVRARDVLQRRATAHPRVRRLLRAQPRRGRAPARRRRASRRHRRRDQRHADDLPHRSGRADPRHPDRDRRGEHPQLVRGAPTRQRDISDSGRSPAPRTPTRISSARMRSTDQLRRADQQRPDAHRRQGRAARAHDLAHDGHAAGHRAAHRRDRRRDTDGPARRRRHRARRDPHAAGRRSGRDAVGRARAEPVDDLPAARFDEAVLRGPASRSCIRRAPTTSGATTPTPTRRSRPASRSPKIAPPCSGFAEPSLIKG